MSIFSFSKNSFEGQLPDETVVLLLRRHWFVLAGWTILIGILALVPFILLGVLGEQITRLGFSSLYWFFVSAYLLFVWFAFFYGVMKYLLDVWIVTDHRVIDSRQRSFFHRVVSEMHISRVQDVSTEVAGLIQTLLTFGNVHIQSAGEQQRFLFRQVPNPNEVKDIIIRANNQFIKMHPSGKEPAQTGL